MSETALLLTAKLLPPSPGPFHLPRERLHEKLSRGLEGRVSVVAGGPGYGKTSLVARFLQSARVESVWLRLDGSDHDPWTLFRYLVETLRQHVPDFGERSSGLWEGLRSQPDEVERLADVFIRDAEESLGGRLVLVLDGIERLESFPACCALLRRILLYQPAVLHVALTARSLPELGIAALVATGEATVLHPDELLFTEEETRALLVETFGLKASPKLVAKVHARTRGWVTALQLLRQTARLGLEGDLPDEVFGRTEEEIFGYFSEEVLLAESEETRDFLLATSLLPVVDPELAAQAIGARNARAMLARLVQRSLFVSSLGERGELYAYDPLFRDFLEKKFHAERGPHEARKLHHAYGHAFAAQGDHAQALAHLQAADEMQATFDLLAAHGRALLRAGAIDEVREGALSCSKHGLRGAFVNDLVGEACRLTGDYTAAVGHFEKALDPAPAGAEPLVGRARAAALQGLAYSLLKIGETERAAEAAEDGLTEAGEEDPVLTARILNTLSIIRYRKNRHEEAIEGWGRALALAREGGDERLTLMVAHNLGLPYAVTGDLLRASECFRLLTREENVRLGPEEGAAYLNLARIATLRGEYLRAASLLDDAQEIAQKWKLQALVADVTEASGTLLRETGHLEAAEAKYASARALFTSLGLLEVLDSLAEEDAILAALRGDVERADRIASGLVLRARAAGSPDRLGSALLALGEIHARCYEPENAQAPLEEADAIFEASAHAYEQCMAGLWLALAKARAGDGRGAKRAAEAALKIAARFDYDGAVVRVANLDPKLRGIIAALPSAPSFLIESPESVPSTAVQPDRADLTIRLLGPVEVYRDPERRIPPGAWKVRKALRILCYLAASRNHRATKDRLVDVLWQDAKESVIDKNFHPTISFLRRALNYEHHVPKNFVLCESGAYRLNPTYRYDIDVEAFEDGVQTARRKSAQGDAPQALAEYGRAFDLYRGGFLEDDDEEWVLGPRSHYESIYLGALAEAAQLHLAQGDPQIGLNLLGRRVEHDPVDEEASVLLMKALGARGHRSAVEKEYRRLRKALEERGSHAPGAEARRAYRTALGEG